MIGIDTNLLVRFLTNDDKIQAKYVAGLIEKNSIFIAKSILLETEWVLRYTYDASPASILQAFKNLLSLKRITIENPLCLLQTLEWYEQGFDFADALHLASNPKTASFATLDKAFIKVAKKLHINLIAAR
jgi:predicted nucleic-acid-binding protein